MNPRCELTSVPHQTSLERPLDPCAIFHEELGAVFLYACIILRAHVSPSQGDRNAAPLPSTSPPPVIQTYGGIQRPDKFPVWTWWTPVLTYRARIGPNSGPNPKNSICFNKNNLLYIVTEASVFVTLHFFCFIWSNRSTNKIDE